MSLVWLNGEFVPLDDAKVSAFDAGLQHGVGLFETMRAQGGRIFRIEQHIARLEESARALRLTERLRTGPLREAIGLTLKKNEFADARIRLTLTGGDLNLLAAARDKSTASRRSVTHTPTILIHAQPLQQYPDAFFEKGVTVTIADARLNPLDPFAGHKTLNYWPRLFALQSAAAVGASESIWFTVTNHLASGSVSNILLVKDGELLTPIARGEEWRDIEIEESEPASPRGAALASPVLPGITRGFLIEHAESAGITVDRRVLDINDLLAADEIFLTNSSWGVLPVTHIEREKIGAGEPGSITRIMRAAWLDALKNA